MSRWNSHKQEQQQVDFEQLLSGKASAVELLSHPNILEEVKGRSTKFTQRIVHPKHRALLNGLIDIALTPRAYMLAHHLALDRAATHAAIEILTSLSEEFIEEIFDREAEEEDAVVQGEREYPILVQLLRVLAAADAEETALAYFNKLVTPFIYQRSEQMIRLVPALLLPPLLAHFANHSVAEVLTKLLEAENEKEFFEAEKVELVGAVCRSLAEERDEERVARNAESLAGFIESLVEKHEDKYEKTKYARLIRGIVERSGSFLFLFALFEAHPARHDTRLHLLHCIEAFLRIHLPSKQHSKISEGEGAPDCFPLQADFAEGLKQWLGSHMIHEFVSDSRLELLAYYKLVKTALAVEPGLVEAVLTQSFLAETLASMRQDPSNNILHNYQREVLLVGVRESERVCRALQEELGLEELFRSSVTERNSRDCFANQIFLIGEAIRERSQKSQLLTPGWSQLSGIIDSKRQFYSTLIGGNPRGEDKWDSVDNENENEMILRSLNQKDFEGADKQIVEERLEVEDMPDKKIMIHLASGLEDLGGTEVLSEEEDDPFASAPSTDPKNKHFFDFELPLDSDKEESDPQNQSNSLEDIPIVIKIESIQDSLHLSGGIRASSASNGMRTSSEQAGSLEVVVEDPLIEQTTQIVIEESFKEEPAPSPKPVYFYREEIEASLRSKYGLPLKPALVLPLKEEIQRGLLCRYGLTLKSEQSRPFLPVGQEIHALLVSKYGLALNSQ